MKEMGLFGITIPEEYGGMGADLSLSLCFEELSRAWMGIAGFIGSHSLACWMIASAAPRAEEPFATGSGDGQAAHRHRAHRAGAVGLQGITRGDRTARVHRSGTKMWITNARYVIRYRLV